MHLAMITTEDGGITPNSTCHIDGRSVLVPEVAPNGSVIAPSRIAAATRELGYRLVNYHTSRTVHEHWVTIDVEPA